MGRIQELEEEIRVADLRIDDLDATVVKLTNSNRKLNRFIHEHGLSEEYIAWIIAKRLTTGEEP